MKCAMLKRKVGEPAMKAYGALDKATGGYAKYIAGLLALVVVALNLYGELGYGPTVDGDPRPTAHDSRLTTHNLPTSHVCHRDDGPPSYRGPHARLEHRGHARHHVRAGHYGHL